MPSLFFVGEPFRLNEADVRRAKEFRWSAASPFCASSTFLIPPSNELKGKFRSVFRPLQFFPFLVFSWRR